MRIFEVSQNNLKDSFSKDLVKSKTWLATELAKIRTDFKNVYVLGSWYGNLSLILFQEHKIKFQHLYNVDVNEDALMQGEELAKSLGIAHDIDIVHKNANDVVYRTPSLIINTSVNNIENAGWFENIPEGTLVVLQSRNKDPGGVNHYNSAAELEATYPLSKVLYSDKLRLQEKQGSYARFMVIGIK
jgi:hypothetical protein